MGALLLTTLPFIAFLGLLVVLAVVAIAFFLPQVEGWLLVLLQRRRTRREEAAIHGRQRKAIRGLQ